MSTGYSGMMKSTTGHSKQRRRHERFLRWRSQLMEKGIQKLDFDPAGVSSFIQINDLKNTPGPVRKELRRATQEAIELLQDNYPELVSRNTQLGTTLVWDLSVLGWEVNYREEFVPDDDEGSYSLIVQKGRKIGWQEGSIRNSFTNREPGKVMLIFENGSFKKKQVLYRYIKTKKNQPLESL